MPSWRRTNATTSCDVIPSALSTSRTPSRAAVNDVTDFLQDLVFYFGERALNPRSGGQHVSSSAELFADRTHVHLFSFRSHAHTHFAVRKLFEKNRGDHAADRAEMIDQPFVVLRQNAELFRHCETQTKTRDAIIGVKTHRPKKIAKKFDSAPGIIFVSQLADPANIDAFAHKLGRDLKRARSCVRILKRAGVGGNRDVKIGRDLGIHRELLALYQFEQDLSCRRRFRVDVNDVAVFRIARMVIDVNAKSARANGGERCAESILNRSVERDDNIDIFRLGGRFRQQFGARQKTVFLEHSFLVPNPHVFAELLERKTQRERASECIAVGTHVTENSKTLMLAQRAADLLELRSAHSCFSRSSASIFCKISTTREP